MKFGAVPIDEAVGRVLVHSLRAGDRGFKKGTRLSADDVAQLRRAKVGQIVVATLDADDVSEDDAAQAVAAAVRGGGLKASAAFTGRCNLLAEAAGIVVVDAGAVDRLNQIDEAITLATTRPFAALESGEMAATVKIIPFAVPRATLDRALAVLRESGPIVRVAPYRVRKAGFVYTTVAGLKDSVIEKTVFAIRARLARVGATLVHERSCPHREEAIAGAVTAALDAGAEIVLVFGASATTDRRDVVPAGIVAAGGTVEHVGMPVDPGNLLVLARHGTVPVIGVPGCARSPKENGFDWVLGRLAAGIAVTPTDIMKMGAGGLLNEIAARPLPREQATGSGRERKSPAATPAVGALILAAGRSVRMGEKNKLLAELDGKPMIAGVVDAALASGARPVLAVTGHEAARVQAALAGRAVTFVHNPDYREGLSTSLRAGLAALPADCAGVIVCLGDMPRIKPQHLEKLIAAFDPTEGRSICVPTFAGKRGNPVLWGRGLFAEMAALQGDVGAKALIVRNEEQVAEIPMSDDAILVDIDSPAELDAEKSGSRTSSATNRL